MKRNKKIISLLLILIFVTSLSSTVLAAEGDKKIVVNGKGVVRIKPDMAEISFTAISRDKNQRIALQNNNKKIDKIINGFKKFGVKDNDIYTEAVYISPEYSYNKDVPKLEGYTASNVVIIVVRDLSKLGSMINEGVNLGADSLDSINYKLSKPEEAYNNALALAIKNAKVKADKIAASTGVKIKSIGKITEKSEYSDFNESVSDTNEKAPENMVTPIKVKDLSIEAILEIEYIF